VSKDENACAPAHSFWSVPRKLTICPDRRVQVPRRRGLDLAGHAVETLHQERAQRPAGAVATEHVEIVQVEVALTVRGTDLRRIDVVQPVVRRDLAGDVQDQPAEAVALVGVRRDAPVLPRQVFVDRPLDIDRGAPIGAQHAMLLPVRDVGPGGPQMVGLDQCHLDLVLYPLDPHRFVHHAFEQARGDVGRQSGGNGFVIGLGGETGLQQRLPDFAFVEGNQAPVAFDDSQPGRPFRIDSINGLGYHALNTTICRGSGRVR
jgi:hypothetical protein